MNQNLNITEKQTFVSFGTLSNSVSYKQVFMVQAAFESFSFCFVREFWKSLPARLTVITRASHATH